MREAESRTFSGGLGGVLSLAVTLGLAGCAPPGEVGEIEAAEIEQCPMAVVEGVDVFSGSGTIDWSQLQASGRGFAFIKVSQGNYVADTNFATNWTESTAVGMVRSPYHFFDGTIDGVTQAQYFLDLLQSNGGLQPGDLPPMLNLECPTSSVQSQAAKMCEGPGANASGWVDSATLSQRIFDWLDTVQQATGRAPIIYSYYSWFADVGLTDPSLTAYPLYIASYNPCAYVPPPWSSATFWQYADNATVPGLPGTNSADADRFFGSAADLQQFIAGGQAPLDGGTPDGASPPVDLAGSAPADLSPTRGGDVHGGCRCDVGAGGHSETPLALCALGLGWLVVRRRACS